MKKAFLIATPILFGLAVLLFAIQYFMPADRLLWPVANASWAMGTIWTLLAMYSRGSLRRSPWVRVIFIGIGLLIFGLLFKLQHWPYGGLLILLSISLIFIAYFFHFCNKRSGRLLDVLKMLYVTATLLLMLLKMQHWSYMEIMMWVAPIITIFTFAVFYLQFSKEKEAEIGNVAQYGDTIFDYGEENDSANL